MSLSIIYITTNSNKVIETVQKIINKKLHVSNKQIISLLSNKQTLQHFLEISSIPNFCPIEWLIHVKLLHHFDKNIEWTWAINYNAKTCIITALLTHEPINWTLITNLIKHGCNLHLNLSSSDDVSSNIITILSSYAYMDIYIPPITISALTNRIISNYELYVYFTMETNNKIPTSNIHHFLTFMHTKTNNPLYNQLLTELTHHTRKRKHD